MSDSKWADLCRGFAFIPLQIHPPGVVEVSSRGGLAWVDSHDFFITKVNGAGAGVIGHIDRAPTCLDGDACDADLAVRGEVLSWRQDGVQHRYVVLVGTFPPGQPGPPLHVHPHTDETFYVADGDATFQLGDREVPSRMESSSGNAGVGSASWATC